MGPACPHIHQLASRGPPMSAPRGSGRLQLRSSSHHAPPGYLAGANLSRGRHPLPARRKTQRGVTRSKQEQPAPRPAQPRPLRVSWTSNVGALPSSSTGYCDTDSDQPISGITSILPVRGLSSRDGGGTAWRRYALQWLSQTAVELAPCAGSGGPEWADPHRSCLSGGDPRGRARSPPYRVSWRGAG